MNGGTRLAHDWWNDAIPDNVEIGARSWLYSSFAFRHYRSRRGVGLRVGNDTGVYVGTSFVIGPRGSVEIGNYCSIVSTIISTNSRVVIKDYALIAFGVVMADRIATTPSDEESDSVPQSEASTDILLSDNVWIGARAIVLGGARVGEGAIVGAGAVVDFDVPPYAIVVGNPGRVVGWKRPSVNR